MSGLQGSDRTVLGHLRPMFPQLSQYTLERSILHPSNREGMFDEFILLQRCIDDLLELRTASEHVSQDTLPAKEAVAPAAPAPAPPPPLTQYHEKESWDALNLGPAVNDVARTTGVPPPGPKVGQHLHPWEDEQTGILQPQPPMLHQQPQHVHQNSTQTTAKDGHLSTKSASASAVSSPSRPGVRDEAPGTSVQLTPRLEHAISEQDTFLAPNDLHTGDTDEESSVTAEEDELPEISVVKARRRKLPPSLSFPISKPKSVISPKKTKSAPDNIAHLTSNSNSGDSRNTRQMDFNQNIRKNLDSIESSVKQLQKAMFPDRRNPNIGPAGQVHPSGRGQKRSHSASASSTATRGGYDATEIPVDEEIIVGDVYQPEVINLVRQDSGDQIDQQNTTKAATDNEILWNVIDDNVVDIPYAEPEVILPPREKTAEEILDERTDSICLMFPKADPTFVKQQLRFAIHPDPETVVCNYLLENPDYPKRQSGKEPDKAVTPAVGTLSGSIGSQLTSPSPVSTVDFYNEYSSTMNLEYCKQAVLLLKAEFLKVSVNDIRRINKWFNFHYAPTRKVILEAFMSKGLMLNETQKLVGRTGAKVLMSNIVIPMTGGVDKIPIKHNSYSVEIRPMKCGRSRIALNFELTPILLAETQYIIDKYRSETESQDHQMAETLNEQEYETEGQGIECGCCYGEWPFDKMVQCYEGHLFCQSCLQSYVQEAVYGQGKSKLECMSDGCEASFPKSELLRAVPSNVIEKFEEKEQEQSLNLADMADLVRCPHCDFAAVLDPSVKVFKCQNKECMKETCRHCKENWEEHFGIPCSEMEKKDETKLRVQFEEKMTMAKIRTCARCKAGFTKSDGCNKMTCPCGAKMCYICRKPNIDYNHFCNHARDPGKKCDKCTNCSLWTNPEEDDERAVQEIKKEAQEARQAQGYADDKLIGAPDESQPKTKKARKQ